MKDIDRFAWRVPAAYLYTLELDSVGMAWEYLRRNSAYREGWLGHSRDPMESAHPWSLKNWEDPGQDARSAEPIWSPVPASSVLLIPVDRRDGRSVTRFEFWRIRGRKSLVHDGTELHLTTRLHPGISRAVLASGVVADQPYAYQIPSDGPVDGRCRAVSEFEARYRTRPQSYARAIRRPDRSALNRMRMLQALDGAAAGASHRDVAAALFGEDVVKVGWSPDGELRAQIRYLLKRGRVLTEGGYRSLLYPDSS